MKNKYEGKSIIDMLKGIGDFSSEGDPDGSMKAAAIEYAQDMGVDINNRDAMMDLSCAVNDKTTELLRQWNDSKEPKENSVLYSMYRDYEIIAHGLMYLNFEKISEDAEQFEEDFKWRERNEIFLSFSYAELRKC